MTALPQTDDTLVVRTDFSDDDAWAAVRAEIRERHEDLADQLEFVDDPAFQDRTAEDLIALVPEDNGAAILVVADKTALFSDETPLLVVDLGEERGRELRVAATAFLSIESNLSIGNMDFDEYADSADEDGIFRGF